MAIDAEKSAYSERNEGSLVLTQLHPPPKFRDETFRKYVMLAAKVFPASVLCPAGTLSLTTPALRGVVIRVCGQLKHHESIPS